MTVDCAPVFMRVNTDTLLPVDDKKCDYTPDYYFPELHLKYISKILVENENTDGIFPPIYMSIMEMMIV